MKIERIESFNPRTHTSCDMSSIRIPARPFMKLTENDIEKIKSKILKELTDK